MAIFNCYISQRTAIIATDTLIAKRDEKGSIIPLNFQSKMYYLPHLNICFFVQGPTELGLLFFEFLQCKVIGDNIYDVINQTRYSSLYNLISPKVFEEENRGRIFVFGYYSTGDELQTYSVRFKDFNVQIERIYEASESVAHIVTEPEMDTSPYDWSSPESMRNSFFELINDQKNINDLLPNANKNSLGGSIIITILYIECNHLQYNIFKMMDFEDKTTNHLAMWSNWNKP